MKSRDLDELDLALLPVLEMLDEYGIAPSEQRKAIAERVEIIQDATDEFFDTSDLTVSTIH